MELSDTPPVSREAAWHEWSLREEIFAAAHQWQWIMVCCLVGALLGWIAAQFWPTPHRVSKELFVGLNVYQSKDDRSPTLYTEGLPFANANDYKNWQMASLNTVIYMDPVIDETLERLRALDPYWLEVDRDELAAMLIVYWRNAGKWRLVARHETPMYATQAVILWQDVVIETVHEAVASAQTALQTDEQMEAIAVAQAELSEQSALLTRLQQNADQQLAELALLDDSAVLNEEKRAALLQALLPIEELSFPGGFETGGPPQSAPVSAYKDWLADLQVHLSAQADAVQIQSEDHRQRYAALEVRYAQTARAALGLSAELLVQKISDRKLDAGEVRPTGVSVLVGASLGFLAWVFVWLIRPGLKALR